MCEQAQAGDSNNPPKYPYEPTAEDREKTEGQEQSPNPRSETQKGFQRRRWPYRKLVAQLREN